MTTCLFVIFVAACAAVPCFTVASTASFDGLHTRTKQVSFFAHVVRDMCCHVPLHTLVRVFVRVYVCVHVYVVCMRVGVWF